MKKEEAIFAAGCFWGVQYQMEKTAGVIQTKVGYIGGFKDNPTYQEVKAHTTGHAEALWVEFDSDVVSYLDLCKVFFEIHDPAQTDGQDRIWVRNIEVKSFITTVVKKEEAEAVIELLREKGYVVNTRLTPVSTFWTAEEYHQHYYDKTGGEPYCHIRTKKF